MTELLYSCTSTLDQPSTPVCATDYGERITHILFSKIEVVAASNVPTAAEFGTAYGNGTLMYFRVASGHRVFLSETDTDVNAMDWHDKKYRVEGKIRLLSEAIARATERLDRYDELYMYYLTDKNYCFGPVVVSPDFSLRVYEGATPIYIDFKLDFYPGIDYSNQDTSYGDFVTGYQILATPDDEGLMTPDGKILIL